MPDQPSTERRLPESGLFISFEGIDGSGKSTQIRLLVAHLETEGYRVCCLREPGGPEVSERIRQLLLDQSLEIEPMAELLLFSAARAQMVAEAVIPALHDGQVVICDRYYDSSTAYQGRGRQLADLEWMEELHRRVTSGVVPKRTYLLELEPEEAHKRRRTRVSDRMETAQGDFFYRVVEAYDEIARAHPGRVVRIDATSSPDEIHRRILRDVARLLEESSGTG